MNKNTIQQSENLFQDEEFITHRWLIFQQSKLGQLPQAIPFNELSMLLPYKTASFVGIPPWFDNAGMWGHVFKIILRPK
jgi:hypothetical protein